MNLYVRTAMIIIFCYFYLIVLLRLLGKKEFSQLNIFDFVVFVLIADLIVMAFDKDQSRLLESIVATSVLVFADSTCSYIALKNKKARKILEGEPTFIITKGKLNYENMRKCKYSMDSLSQHLRQQSVSTVSEIEYAILEPNGHLSLLKKIENKVLYPDYVINDGVIMHDVLAKINRNEDWLKKQLKKLGEEKIEDIALAVPEKDGLFILKK